MKAKTIVSETNEVINWFRNEIEFYRAKKKSLKEQLDKVDNTTYIKVKKELLQVQKTIDELSESENKLINIL